MSRGIRSSIARQRDKPGVASKAHIILNVFSHCMCYYILSVPLVGVIGVVKAWQRARVETLEGDRGRETGSRHSRRSNPSAPP